MPRSDQEVFQDSVEECVRVLLGEWCRKLTRESDGGCRVECKRATIYVDYSITSIGVRLLPASDNSSYEGPTDLFWVLEAVAPRLQESERWPRPLHSSSAIHGEVRRQLGLLADYCRPLLEGNASAWGDVQSWPSDWGGRKRHPDESQPQFLQRLLERADCAWSRKEYWAAADFYTRYCDSGGKLTLRRLIRMRYAACHTFRLP